MILRSRDDLDAMIEEYDDLGPSVDRLNDLKRVVGRDYDSVDWYALEIEPSERMIADRFRWSGDQPLVPYFRARYRGLDYSARDMGLGEFSVHFLFWILEQYREARSLTLPLDEPDAFLPPIGVSALLSRVQQMCLKRGWQVVLTTHSQEMIARALDQEAFTLLRVDEHGGTVAVHSTDDPGVGDTLLGRPAVEHVIFCEDESAYYLTRAMIEHADRQLLRAATVMWGTGNGYLSKLTEHLPRPPRPGIRFAFAFDGDQRDSNGRWPVVFLPSNSDPDALFMSLKSDPESVSAKIGCSKGDLARRLDALEGSDPHDWVNGLADEFGRVSTLNALAARWVEQNPDDASEFVRRLCEGWS